ncbi:unnamed protein product [Peniophora sp. CBMAI 1063]|nr:unnamed protein product [Peniophora sp. CBMAI 1063]
MVRSVSPQDPVHLEERRSCALDLGRPLAPPREGCRRRYIKTSRTTFPGSASFFSSHIRRLARYYKTT